MNRRSFLKLIGATIAAAIVPAELLKKPEQEMATVVSDIGVWKIPGKGNVDLGALSANGLDGLITGLRRNSAMILDNYGLKVESFNMGAIDWGDENLNAS